jgi:hypothetical protein
MVGATRRAAGSRERAQGRPVGVKSGERISIIHHPDVRRMMMTMKCKVEAMRALAYTWAAAFDNSTRHADQAECERQRQVMELLAPIVKGWCTETGNEVAYLGVQVHGGVGFIEETGAAQHCRDARISKHHSLTGSYAFSQFNTIWGWASWRRSWNKYDITMQAWPAWSQQGGLSKLPISSTLFDQHWQSIFHRAFKGEIDTWDFQWTFNVWESGGLTALPKNNLITNLGFGDDATHTTFEAPDYVIESYAEELSFPLAHPSEIKQNIDLDQSINKYVFSFTPFTLLKSKLKGLLKSLPGIKPLWALLKRRQTVK